MRRVTLYILALLMTVEAFADGPKDEPTFSTSGAFFALHVRELAPSVEWYRDKLGLRVVMEMPKTDGVAVAVLEGDGLIVELIEKNSVVRGAAAGDETSERGGFFKAGMIIDHLDETVRELRSRGVEIAFGPFPAKHGQRANVIIRDLEGNLIQLFEK